MRLDVRRVIFSHAISGRDRLAWTGIWEEFVPNLRLPEEVVQSLTYGDPVSDFEIDQVLPSRLRDLSDIQWSSVRVARTIARLLKDSGKARFIDLGCGVGKLCLLLALTTDLQVFGIERRASLAEFARRLNESNAPGRVSILHGDALDLNWDAYDILYLYNPFFEHKFNKASPSLIDRDIELGNETFGKYVDGAHRRLCLLRPGQRVITYHGYGGAMPKTMKLIESVRIDRGSVKLWEQAGTATS